MPEGVSGSALHPWSSWMSPLGRVGGRSQRRERMNTQSAMEKVSEGKLLRKSLCWRTETPRLWLAQGLKAEGQQGVSAQQIIATRTFKATPAKEGMLFTSLAWWASLG